MTMHVAGGYLRSVPKFQNKVMRTKSQWATYAAYGDLGFNDQGTTVGRDDAMFTIGWTPNQVTSITSDGSGFTFGPGYSLAEGSGWKTWDIQWQPTEVKFLVNDSLRTTHSTHITALPMSAQINSYEGNPDMKMDWVLVRDMVTPEPSSASGSEETQSPGTHTLTYTAGPNGTISGVSPQTVNQGANGTLVTAVPNTGYHFTTWSDGVLTAARTDLNVTANITVTASFAINTYQLTVSTTTGGTITMPASSPVTVNHGVATTITAVATVGYTFTGWTVVAGTASIATPSALSTTATLTSGNATVRANFTLNQYMLTYTAGPNGTISGTSPLKL